MEIKFSKNITYAVLISGAMLFATQSMADPFTVTSQLTGDPRLDNPENLIVDVTITGDTTSDTTFWTVDINSPAHPDIKLDAFYFNIDLDPAEVRFTNFNPSSWSVTSLAKNAKGSGSADFLFEVDSSSPATNVTNSQDLTFEGILAAGFWSDALFSNAGDATSSDALLGSFQLGAHLQSLERIRIQSDSGYATGNYGDNGDGGNGEPIPEPMTMLLLGTGLAGLAGLRMKKKM